MVQARSELAAGDQRLLYLAWLLALQSDLWTMRRRNAGAARAEEPERRPSGGGGILRDRREPHRRGGSFEPGDRGAWRAGGMDRIASSGGEGFDAGAGGWRGGSAGPGAPAAPVPGGQRKADARKAAAEAAAYAKRLDLLASQTE